MTDGIEPRRRGLAAHLGERRRDDGEAAQRERRDDEPDRLGARAVEAPNEEEPRERQREGQERARGSEPRSGGSASRPRAVHRRQQGRARGAPARGPRACTRSMSSPKAHDERRGERVVEGIVAMGVRSRARVTRSPGLLACSAASGSRAPGGNVSARARPRSAVSTDAIGSSASGASAPPRASTARYTLSPPRQSRSASTVGAPSASITTRTCRPSAATSTSALICAAERRAFIPAAASAASTGCPVSGRRPPRSRAAASFVPARCGEQPASSPAVTASRSAARARRRSTAKGRKDASAFCIIGERRVVLGLGRPMPDPQVLYIVTAVVVLGLVTWVIVVLARPEPGRKDEPRALPPEPRGQQGARARGQGNPTGSTEALAPLLRRDPRRAGQGRGPGEPARRDRGRRRADRARTRSSWSPRWAGRTRASSASTTRTRTRSSRITSSSSSPTAWVGTRRARWRAGSASRPSARRFVRRASGRRAIRRCPGGPRAFAARRSLANERVLRRGRRERGLRRDGDDRGVRVLLPEQPARLHRARRRQPLLPPAEPDADPADDGPHARRRRASRARRPPF